ncbi:MAG: pentapeptide repeat-containing protein [Nostocaceae cyanobacterium CSU_2_110]|nr:pentapeptide repeat-containing protein [Candidatus Methylacidiphilales bacterium]NJS16983.1 pentapeptide repeat-containing protein [Nostocaceae cyanobacterium CSU_2_110]
MQKHRFKHSIEQLAAKELKTRVFAIYELEEIVRFHPQFYWEGMQILADFVRSLTSTEYKTKFQSSELLNESSNQTSSIGTDIQAALTVIGSPDLLSPDLSLDLSPEMLDLSYVDIRGANLDNANLQRVILYQANLAGVSLIRASLCGTVLSAANLAGANLSQANLSQGILGAANLVGTNLTEANLYQANLFLANLSGANLDGANLDGANLRDANLHNTKFEVSV